MAKLTDAVELCGRRGQSRVVFGPHETNLGHERGFSPRHVAYYERRARGGAGIIVTESASVHPLDWPYERAPLADSAGRAGMRWWPPAARTVRSCSPAWRIAATRARAPIPNQRCGARLALPMS